MFANAFQSNFFNAKKLHCYKSTKSRVFYKNLSLFNFLSRHALLNHSLWSFQIIITIKTIMHKKRLQIPCGEIILVKISYWSVLPFVDPRFRRIVTTSLPNCKSQLRQYLLILTTEPKKTKFRSSQKNWSVSAPPFE